MILDQCVILVTGGAVRLGKTICRELADSSAKLAIHYFKSHEAAVQLASELRAQGCECDIFSADLSKVVESEKLVESVLQRFGRIDVLVNNAAIFYATPLGTVSEAQWDELMNLNLKGVFFLSQKVASHMLSRKSGKIINIADSSARHPFPSYLPYSISKAGVMALTRGLSRALAPHILVNCVNPGPVLLPENYSDEEREKAIRNTLLKREGRPEDVARTVRFLIEGSDYITGSCIDVDGGRHIR